MVMSVDNMQQYFKTFDSRQARELEFFFREVFANLDLDVAFNLTGDVTGKHTGNLNIPGTVYTTDGAIAADDSFVQLDATDNTCDMTIAAPAAGRFLVISCVNASNAVTVTLTAGDFDGTGASGDVATFDAAEETLVLFGLSATRFVILENIGSVAIG